MLRPLAKSRLRCVPIVYSSVSSTSNVIDSFTDSVASTVVYGENSARATDLTAAVNQFDDAAGNVTYLSRKDSFR